MAGNDEISLYEATRILIEELNTTKYDFSEAVHKYVIGHMVEGSKTQVSFRSLIDEYEGTLHMAKGTNEIKYRENCIFKMLEKVALKLIMKEVDMREMRKDEMSYNEMEKFLRDDLDLFNQEPPDHLDDESKIMKQKLRILARDRDENEIEVEDEVKDEENKDQPKKKWVPHKITEKEESMFKDTLDYIMDGKSYTYVDDFIELMRKYLEKQKHWLEVIYKLKQFVKRRHCSLFESFNTYKSYDRFKNTELHPEEYLKVLLSIGFEISENSLIRCLDTFEYSSAEKIDYTMFVAAVENSINPRTKRIKNIRKFKSEDEMYEYIADKWEIYFPLGSLLKDHDYDNNGRIDKKELETILRKGAHEMTEADLKYLMHRLDDGSGQIDIYELIDNVNYFIRDWDKIQKLETRIPDKMLNPLDKTDK
jgi:Ca2+-binding EF-hand superfamily protein